jgi:acyl carrier protein
MKKVSKHVLQTVRKISGDVKMNDEKLLTVDYLDLGLIDSFQIVEFISKIERKFSIRFSAQDLESEKFRTLKGVSEIIEGYTSSK